MKKLPSKLCAAMCLVLALIVAIPLQAADSFVGVWKLNLTKSRFSPGAPPIEQTTRLESADGGLKEIGDRVNADGTTTRWEWTAKYDGKDYPVKGDPDQDAVSLKKVDDNTLEVVSKKANKVTTSMRTVVAIDGKSQINTTTGVNARGQQINNILFFDRQ